MIAFVEGAAERRLARLEAIESIRELKASPMRATGRTCAGARSTPFATPGGAASMAPIEAAFHALHRQKNTFDLEGDPIEDVTCHVSGSGGRAAANLVVWLG
jgi:hypothetical protein